MFFTRDREMLVTFLDTETTGVDAENDRIIEIAMQTYDLSTEKMLKSYTQRINPQMMISASAFMVHRISNEMLVGCPTWKDVADDIFAFLSETDVLIAHNLEFDLPFIENSLNRCGHSILNKKGFCTMENGRWATFDGKFPKLKELCFCFAIDYDENEAHSAEYDTAILAQCFFHGYKRNFFKLDF